MTPRRTLHANYLFLFYGVAHIACVSSGDRSSSPGFEEVVQLANEVGWLRPASAELIDINSTKMNCWRNSTAEIIILGRIPAQQLLVVNTAEGWLPTTADKDLTPNWKRAVDWVMSGANCRQAKDIATDLAGLLVDPDRAYGRVLNSLDDIPKAVGEDHLAGHWDLLAREIRPPQWHLRSGESKTVSFFTWDYFGGEVKRWRVPFRADPGNYYEIIAEGVGDFGFYH